MQQGAVKITKVKGETSKDIYKAYRITNTVNGKIYIGITSGSMKRRWAAHIGAAKRGAISAISRAIAKYGVEKFTFEHIASSIDWSSLQLLEQALIHQHGTFRGRGYNKTLGGEGNLGGGNPIEVDGDVYPSLSIAVEAFGLGQSAVYLRIHKLGWSVGQAFELAPPPISPAAKGIEVDGVYYESITKAARDFGLSERHVNSRLWHGWSIEEAFNLKDRRDTEKKKSLVVGRNRYASIAEFARQHNVDPKLTRQRVYLYGWTPEQAIGLEPPPKRKGNREGLAIAVQGVKYPSIKAAAIKYGLEAATVVARLNKFNWTIEQAFDLAPRPPSPGVKRGHSITVGNVEYTSWTKAAMAHSLSIQVVKWRISEGWSIDEAFGLIEREKQRPPRSVVFQGVTYPSISAACRDLGLNRGAVGQQLLRGKSPEEALAAVKG